MNVKLAPAWYTRTPTYLEGEPPGFGTKLSIDASGGAEAVLTSNFALAPGHPLPPSAEGTHSLEVHGVLFPVAPSVLPGGERVLRGSLPVVAAASLFPSPPPVPAAEAQDPPPEGGQDLPAPEPAVRKGRAEAARLFAESRDALAEARSRLPEIDVREKELRQELESLASERRGIEESMPGLVSAAAEHRRALMGALGLDPQGG